MKDETDQFVTCLVLPECLSVKIAFYPRTVKRIVTELMPSFLFHCFSLLLPHLYSSPTEKRSERFLRFATSGSSLCLYPLLLRNIIFFAALTRVARAKKKFAHAISEHYLDFEHAYVYWIWLRGSTSYVIHNILTDAFISVDLAVLCLTLRNVKSRHQEVKFSKCNWW